MERAVLHGMDGIGELQVTYSPEGVALQGRWQTVGYSDLSPILAAGKSGEVVTYHGPIYAAGQPQVLLRDVLVRLWNVRMDAVGDTGDARVTASLEAVGLPTVLFTTAHLCTLVTITA